MARRRKARADDAPAGMSPLSAEAPAPVGRRRAYALLGGEQRAAWLGDVIEAGVAGTGRDRYVIDLELQVTELAPRLAFRKAAFVDIGPVSDPKADTIRLPISWQAAGMAPLFPVFSGILRWSDGTLQLDGWYAPPGGSIGMVADRMVLNVAARATARLLLERIAAAMCGTADLGDQGSSSR
ncbi:MAG TPA: hypothetical protein VI733_04850 [Candidatus Limnocylindria bacterium]|nr:hypothetical protein [Candidatus Limnocylindria bacterium]